MPAVIAALVWLAVAGSAAGQDRSLDQANGRWAGVRCTLKVSFQMNAGTYMDGWKGSRFLTTSGTSRGKVIKVGIGVSDPRALEKARRIVSRRLPEGTELLALGWRFRDAGKGRDLVLELRFADLPVQALMRFEAGETVEDLPALERVLRSEICQMADAQAAEAGAPSATQPAPVPRPSGEPAPRPEAPAPAPAQPRDQAAAPAPETAPVFNPAVSILGASVSPARAARGTEVELLINYKVEGLPAGTPFEVVEHRGLRSGDARLGDFEEKMPRAAGTYTSSQKIKVPEGLAPGLYTFEATVTLAGRTATTSALFEVR